MLYIGKANMLKIVRINLFLKQIIIVFYIMKGTITLHTERGHPFCKYKAGDTLGDSDTMINVTNTSFSHL
jgi:hypothetical protein